MPPVDRPRLSYVHVVALLAAAVFGAALLLARYGLDFVDESYFLSLIADPGANRDNGEVFLFGFLVHPAYAALGQDIALLRVLGLVVLGTTAGWMAYEVLRYVEEWREPRGTGASGRGWGIIVVVASVVSACAINVRVPSYRSISFLALMLVAVALVWVSRGHAWRAGLLLGTAVWLAVVARPTTGVAVMIVVPCVLLAAKSVTKVLAAATALGVLLAAGTTMLISRMDAIETVTYLYRGYTQIQLLSGYTSVRGMLGLVPPDLAGFVLLGFPLLATGLLADFVHSRRPRLSSLVIAATVVAFLLAVAIVVSSPLRFPVNGDPNAVLPMALVIPAWAFAILLAHGRRGDAPLTKDRRLISLLALLAVAPYVASVGTNLPFTETMALASTFWVLAAVIVARCSNGSGGVQRFRALLTSAICLSVSATFLAMLVAQVGLGPEGGPMRDVGVAGGTLMLTSPDAAVLDLLSDVRSAGGITDRTPVVDLTGIGSGYRFQLGPHPVGRAFFFGIFPRAEAAAASSLAWESCEERAGAWLIHADDNPWDVSEAFTRGLLDLDVDYDRVATFSPTQGPPEWRGIRMEVLRPRSTVAQKLGC